MQGASWVLTGACHPTVWMQVGSLPRGAAVEVQPILADPASSALEDSDDERDDNHLVESTGEGRRLEGSADSGHRMQGWIGRLRNGEGSAKLTVDGRHVGLELRALSVPGRFCRCHVAACFAATATAAEQRPNSSAPMAATDLNESRLVDDNYLTPAAAGAIAGGLTALLAHHLEASNLSPRATCNFKAYHVGHAGAAVADALPRAAQRLRTGDTGELVSLPVLAVGMSTSLNAFLLFECMASRQEQS